MRLMMEVKMRREMEEMSKTRIRVYAYLVFNGLRTIESIPEKFREEVKKEVERLKNEGTF